MWCVVSSNQTVLYMPFIWMKQAMKISTMHWLSIKVICFSQCKPTAIDIDDYSGAKDSQFSKLSPTVVRRSDLELLPPFYIEPGCLCYENALSAPILKTYTILDYGRDCNWLLANASLGNPRNCLLQIMKVRKEQFLLPKVNPIIVNGAKWIQPNIKSTEIVKQCTASTLDKLVSYSTHFIVVGIFIVYLCYH